ncbi:MAG: epoxide hydrolase [SAR202 cluster bacterium]|nr:multidrug MFS transporter [Chloroflexota bacterium]MQG22236.1 epoxide hydrolase [SAR202 cluster bacterium]|tara:strand:+ start:1104 stop:2270 length:1167 start_codon:yes stop_codon:yes gene_type:complete
MNLFKIDINEEILKDLKYRLENTRWPDEIPGLEWQLGTNLDYLKELVEYWKNDFDWQKHETALNQFDHFITNIEGLKIHFIHQKSSHKDAIPIVLTHGWPGTFYEMHKMIPLLTNPEINGGNSTDSFDVIVPSLPGYGFSSKPTKHGINIRETAKMWHSLMTDTLGYKRYAAYGGDIGTGVTSQLGYMYPDKIIGIHMIANLINGLQPYLGPGSKSLSKIEQAHTNRTKKWMAEEGGYYRMHSTKPQTLSYGLNDSPVGLASWIIEKYRAWSDCNGDIESSFTKDELLITLTIYWATETINSSIRMYFEYQNLNDENIYNNLKKSEKINTPARIVVFPGDISDPPKEWADRVYNSLSWQKMSKGGHFAALEEPELLVNDIREFFRILR